MPPKKQNAAKKATAKAKIVEDKTFGLKNKKNSKKVQQYVKRVEQEAEQKVEGRRRGASSGAGSSNPNSAAAKKAALAAKLEELQLMNQPVANKKKKMSEEEEAKRKAREEEEAERIRIANLPVEDQIEEERAKLKTKTPVTLELFLAWKKKKGEERERQEKAALEKAQKGMSKAEKARGGGLTGRQLFEKHQDIFVDDAEADGNKYERDEKAWIGDDAGEEQAEGEAAGGADSQNTPADEHEPPVDPDVDEAGVGDESLFA